MSNSVLPLPKIDPPEEIFARWRGYFSWAYENGTEIIIAGAVGIGIFLLLIGARALGCRLLRTDKRSWRVPFERALARTTMFFIVMLTLKLVTGPLEAPPALDRIISVLFVIATAFQAAIWARALIISFIEQRAGIQEHGTLGTAIDLIRVLVSFALFAIATILILDNLGVNVTGLIAGLGIGGIAIGLAAQGIFADLFAALSIIFDKPFRRGDSINVGGNLSGTVEHIGLKTTRLRALDGEQVVFGNAELLKQRLHNFALLTGRRVVMRFGVIYQTPVEVLESLPGELKTIVDRQEAARFDRAHVSGFGASSIDLEMVFQVHSAEYGTFMDTRQAVMFDIMRRFAELGVEFAYPTTVNFTAGPDGKAIMPYPPVTIVAEDDEGALRASR